MRREGIGTSTHETHSSSTTTPDRYPRRRAYGPSKQTYRTYTKVCGNLLGAPFRVPLPTSPGVRYQNYAAEDDEEGGGGGAQSGGGDSRSGGGGADGEQGADPAEGADSGVESGGPSAIDTKGLPFDASEPEVPDDTEFSEWIVNDKIEATVILSNFDYMDTSPDPVVAFYAPFAHQICAH